MSTHTRSGLARETVTADLPTRPVGSPPSSRFHVSPPSVDRKTPDSSEPEVAVQGFRSARHAEAKTMRGFDGLIAKSTAPVESEIARTWSHVSPPSVVRNTPRSGLGPKGSPSAATKAMSASCGWTLMSPIWPEFGSPMWVHESPPLVLR